MKKYLSLVIVLLLAACTIPENSGSNTLDKKLNPSDELLNSPVITFEASYTIDFGDNEKLYEVSPVIVEGVFVEKKSNRIYNFPTRYAIHTEYEFKPLKVYKGDDSLLTGEISVLLLGGEMHGSDYDDYLKENDPYYGQGKFGNGYWFKEEDKTKMVYHNFAMNPNIIEEQKYVLYLFKIKDEEVYSIVGINYGYKILNGNKVENIRTVQKGTFDISDLVSKREK